jgi:hypothetical protein
MCYTRFKLALTEDWPTIKPYDEAAWANLADSRLPIKVSLAMLEAVHERWVALLESMTEADFQKGFAHPERGSQNWPQRLRYTTGTLATTLRTLPAFERGRVGRACKRLTARTLPHPRNRHN